MLNLTQEISPFSLNFLSTQSCTTTSNHLKPPTTTTGISKPPRRKTFSYLFLLLSFSGTAPYSSIAFQFSRIKSSFSSIKNIEERLRCRGEELKFSSSSILQGFKILLSYYHQFNFDLVFSWRIIRFSSSISTQKLQVLVSAYLLKCLFQSIFQLLNFLKLNIEIACKFHVDSDYSICFVEFIDLDPFLEP